MKTMNNLKLIKKCINVFSLVLLTAVFSCSKDSIQENTSLSIDENQTARNGFTYSDDHENYNCDDYFVINPSGDGVTGTFTLKMTLNMYDGNQEYDDGSCNFITFKGSYNKNTNSLSKVKASYNSSWEYIGERRVRFKIYNSDINWYPRNGLNEFRLSFTMEHQTELSTYGGGMDSGNYPNTENDDDENEDEDDINNDLYNGNFIPYHTFAEGKYIDFVVE